MVSSLSRIIPLLFLSSSLIASPSYASSSDNPPQTPPANPGLQETYDQIVRLNLVQGDVRVFRGKDAEHATREEWGQAVVNMPIESGFSLVTGTGRAEIEFEDASTVFLGENSVLIFDELTSTGGVPRTTMTLVSGGADGTVQVRDVKTGLAPLQGPTGLMVGVASKMKPSHRPSK